MPVKRRRTESGSKPGAMSRQQLARRASYWRRKKYPSSKYFARYFPRTSASRKLYGASYKTATARQREMRAGENMVGQGMYTGDGSFWSDAWRSIRTPLYDAAATGVKTVAPWSSPIVDATRGVMKAHGYGAYGLSKNALVDAGSSTDFQAPVFGPVSDTGAIQITHREYIGNIYAPTSDEAGFKLQSFDVNPGLAKTFPWLAQLAANYDSYHINQLMFSFKSTVSEFQTETGVVGQVMMATQYNQREPKFASKMQMMQYHGVVSAKTNSNAVLGVECAPGKTAGDDVKFIRYENLSPGEDLKDYDKGRVSIATTDIPEKLQGQAIGELWVSYNVLLMHPKVLTGSGDAIQQDCLVAMPEPLAYQSYLRQDQYTSSIKPIVWPQNDTEVYKGTHNSIGCLVEETSDDHDGFMQLSSSAPRRLLATVQQGTYSSGEQLAGVKITFPANYAGRVKVVLQINTNLTESANETEATTKMKACALYVSGEIDAEKDMLLGHQTGAFINLQPKHSANALTCLRCSDFAQHVENYTIGPVADSDMVKAINIEAHVTVRQAVGGKDNFLFLVCQPLRNASGGGSYYGTLVSAMLTISEYNSALNGNEDTAFVNSTGHQLDLD